MHSFVLYIDPGTGSMLFTILVGVLSVVVFFIRGLFMKLRFAFSGGNAKADKNLIPYVIFADDKRYWNIFGPICDEFEKRETPLTYFTASSDDPALKKEYKYVKCEFLGEGNKAFSRMNMLKADVVLSTTPSLDVFQWKRSRDVKWYAHIPHGIYDLTIYRIYGIDYYDAILLSGPVFEKSIRDLENLRNLPSKEIITVGMPYLDRMHEKLKQDELKTEINSENKKTTVLLAPSWGENSILNRFGEKMIDALINTGHEIIIRPHPQSFKSEKELMDRLMERYPDGSKVSWNRDNDNFDVLNKADILISDFSGVIYDFCLVFNKPVIYSDFEFDDSIYDAHWLDSEPWLFETLRKIGRPIGANYETEIGNLIASCLESSKITNELSIAREESWNHIGKSVELTVDYMINKRTELVNKANMNSKEKK